MEERVKRNDLYRMLGHNLRVTTVKGTNKLFRRDAENVIRERTVFLTCADDCDCGLKFCGKVLWPVKLQILERHLNNVTLDKF